MDFFQEQDRARRNSIRLLLLLLLSVISLIGITTVLLGLIWQLHATGRFSIKAIDIELLGYVSMAVIVVVLLGWLYKAIQLSNGGKVVAEQLGGRLLNLQPENLEERRLLNVVEEMALAAGIPVPPVYLLEDSSINAFAAGLRRRDAVIGITSGAIQQLNRDELQGVIAHEFSHILHGDMRLNLRLVACLHGILLLGLIGRSLLRNLGRTHGISINRGSLTSRLGGTVLLFLAGMTLLILGYSGSFFGKLIQAAVSRQREFLADASAVQYTRNPQGIAGALKKLSRGTYLKAERTPEFSHMFFAQGLALSQLMATHPPLDERILRIDPSWHYKKKCSTAAENEPPPTATEQIAGFNAFASPASIAIASIGQPGPQHLHQARLSLSELDEQLHQAAHESLGALALLYGLLLGQDRQTRQQRENWMLSNLPSLLSDKLRLLLPALEQLDAGQRLPLLDLALPTLKQLDPSVFASLKGDIASMLAGHKDFGLIEWCLLRIVEHNLGLRRAIEGNLPLKALGSEIHILLTTLAQETNGWQQAARQAFEAAWATLPFPAQTLSEQREVNLLQLNKALNRLNLMRPLEKPQLLKAMVLCIEHDGHIGASEAELLRATADILDCPMPPLLNDSTNASVGT